MVLAVGGPFRLRGRRGAPIRRPSAAGCCPTGRRGRSPADRRGRPARAPGCAFCSTSSMLTPSSLLMRAQDAEDLGHDLRRQPERRLVQQQQLGPQHQRAADRQHLLLAARQRARLLVAALAEPRETRVHLLDVLRRRAALSRRTCAPRRRFSSTDSAVKVPRPSGTWATPRRTTSSVALPTSCWPSNSDAAAGAHHLADGAQRGRLAGAVGAEDGGDAAGLEPEVDAVQHLRRAVGGVQARSPPAGR